MSKTDTYEDEILKHGLGIAASAFAATVYIAFLTADPGESGALTEPTDPAYARQAAAFALTASGQAKNSTPVELPVATADNGAITHFAVCDSLTGGVVRYYAVITTPKNYNTYDTVRFAANALVITEG